MDLRQFKLNNNEEIICEVLEWDNEQNSAMVITKALKIIATDDFENGMRYYSFKPWLLMNNDPEAKHSLNADHIVSESLPSKVALDYFEDVLIEMNELLTEEKSELERVTKSYSVHNDSDAFANVITLDTKKLH